MGPSTCNVIPLTTQSCFVAGYSVLGSDYNFASRHNRGKLLSVLSALHVLAIVCFCFSPWGLGKKTLFGGWQRPRPYSPCFKSSFWMLAEATSSTFRQEKRAQRLSFWVRRPPGGVGVFHAKGWWPKTSCPPSKLCLPWVSKRGIRDVPGILPGCPGPLAVFKKFVQKNFVRIFRSLNMIVFLFLSWKLAEVLSSTCESQSLLSFGKPAEVHPHHVSPKKPCNFTVLFEYHSFQNHYTHKITIFKLFRSLQLQFSGPTGINFRYSYSFVGLTEYFFTDTVRYSYAKKWSVELFSKITVTVT